MRLSSITALRSKLRVVGAGVVCGLLLIAGSQSMLAQCLYNAGTYTCSGNLGVDAVVGTTGNDIFEFVGVITGQLTVISGGANTTDTLDFSAISTGVTVDLSNQTGYQNVTAAFQIWFTGFTRVILEGSSQGDTLTGTSGYDMLMGGSGNDTLNGGDGNDTFFGGSGNDILNGENGNDALFSEAGDDVMSGGSGFDVMVDTSNNDLTVNMNTGSMTGNGTDSIANIENITLADGDDTVIGDASDSVIVVGNGSNTVSGGPGNDAIYGGTGVDVLSGDDGSDTFEAYDGDDIITGGTGIDDIRGGSGTDTRGDTNPADCAGEAPTGIENDLCLVAPTPSFTSGSASRHDTGACFTRYIRLDVSDRRTAVIYGTAPEGTLSTLFIGEIPMGAIRHVTIAERNSGQPIWITGRDSTSVPGWRMDIYWQDNYYGLHVSGPDGFSDDTGATCAF